VKRILWVSRHKCLNSQLEALLTDGINLALHSNDNALNKSFDRVFICRSGAWIPTWLDDKFDKFISDCPLAYKRNIGLNKREFNIDEVKKLSSAVSDVILQM